MIGIDCNNPVCKNPLCTCDPCDCTEDDLCSCCVEDDE